LVSLVILLLQPVLCQVRPVNRDYPDFPDDRVPQAKAGRQVRSVLILTHPMIR